MDTLLTRTTLVTGGPTGQVIRDGALAVQGDRIVAVGASSELEKRYPALPGRMHQDAAQGLRRDGILIYSGEVPAGDALPGGVGGAYQDDDGPEPCPSPHLR